MLACAGARRADTSLAVERTERLVSAGKDVSGAGASFISPGWLTALQRNWGDAATAVRDCGVVTGCLGSEKAAEKRSLSADG